MEHFRVVKVVQAAIFSVRRFFYPTLPQVLPGLVQCSADMRWYSTEGVPHCGILPLGRSAGGMICSCIGLIYTPRIYIKLYIS